MPSHPSSGRDEEARDWDLLIESLQNRTRVPFFGAGASPGLPKAGALARKWARQTAYPFPDRENLARVMQYAVIAEFNGDANALKTKIADDVFRSATLPSDPNDIHTILAKCQLPIYITTNYDTFLEQALTRSGKRPYWNLSPWYGFDADDERPQLPAEDPTSDRPFVFHLHGQYEIPHSMVLTEDDYIDFQVRLANRDRLQDPTDDRSAMMPRYVRSRLRRSPLLFVGYGLQDHTFWTLFRTLQSDLSYGQRSRHVSLQLDPRGTHPERVRDYLTARFAAQKIAILWMSLDEFTDKLAARLREV